MNHEPQPVQRTRDANQPQLLLWGAHMGRDGPSRQSPASLAATYTLQLILGWQDEVPGTQMTQS